jgi:hypothetical protein
MILPSSCRQLSHIFRLREKDNLQLLAEGFNITNRTNYASVNNVVGAGFGLTPGFTTFDVRANVVLSPAEPLGFTSGLSETRNPGRVWISSAARNHRIRSDLLAPALSFTTRPGNPPKSPTI